MLYFQRNTRRLFEQRRKEGTTSRLQGRRGTKRRLPNCKHGIVYLWWWDLFVGIHSRINLRQSYDEDKKKWTIDSLKIEQKESDGTMRYVLLDYIIFFHFHSKLDDSVDNGEMIKAISMVILIVFRLDFVFQCSAYMKRKELHQGWNTLHCQWSSCLFMFTSKRHSVGRIH